MLAYKNIESSGFDPYDGPFKSIAHGVLCFSEDGGKTWIPVPHAPPNEVLPKSTWFNKTKAAT